MTPAYIAVWDKLNQYMNTPLKDTMDLSKFPGL